MDCCRPGALIQIVCNPTSGRNQTSRNARSRDHARADAKLLGGFSSNPIYCSSHPVMLHALHTELTVPNYHSSFQATPPLFGLSIASSTLVNPNTTSRIQSPLTILWLDCIGGLVVGVVVLASCWLLAAWEGLPLSVVVLMGMANLAYGSYSLCVTTRRRRPMYLLKVLAAANIAWLPVCIAVAALWWNQITSLGLLHVICEGAYVAGLGYTEWKIRNLLAVT